MEDNKLIAEFMGGVMTTPDPRCKHVSFMRGSNPISPTKERYYTLSQLKYNKKWGWLIPVIKEIHKVEQAFLFDDTNVVDDLDDALKTLDMESTFKCAVEFIKYYNENKLG